MKRLFRIITLLFLFLSLTVPFSPYALDVHFIDVGQGDSILIREAQTSILIDGGDRWDWVAEKIVHYLNEQNIQTINAIISTHPHTDHIGVLPAVLRSFKVEAVYDSGRVHTTRNYENYLILIDELDIPFHTPRRGDVIIVGNLEMQVLHPAGDVEQYSLNNASVVLRLVYEKVSFLFTGDIEREAEQEILESGLNAGAVILKVGHHGSRSSSSGLFLDAVQPEVAVIQVGADNRYGHPHAETLQALEARGIEVYRNDLHGHVVIRTDGNTYRIETEKSAQPRAPPGAGIININTASYEELQKITGIGPVIAERIIEYRQSHGPFRRIEDIKKVSGIGEGRFKQMKNQITVEDGNEDKGGY